MVLELDCDGKSRLSWRLLRIGFLKTTAILVIPVLSGTILQENYCLPEVTRRGPVGGGDVMKLTLRCYAVASTTALLGLLFFAVITREGLYSVLTFLLNARISTALIINFLLIICFWVGRKAVHFCLGQLRELELEQIYEGGSGFLMDTVMFLVLTSPTVVFSSVFPLSVSACFLLDGEEVPTSVLFKYVSLVVVLKILNLICQIRVAHVFESGIPRSDALLRLFCLMLSLFLFDFFTVIEFAKRTNAHSSMFLWLLFECLGTLVIGGTTIGRFCLNYIDFQMENGWSSKSTAVFLLDLMSDVLSLGTVLAFMCLFIVNHPSQLPIHMTAYIIQVIRTLTVKLRSFQRCRLLVKEMSQRFPEATFEEMEEADTCVICRDILYEGSRKLPCQHIFHIECLKAWFVQQQTCPTCRSDVLVKPTAIIINPSPPSQTTTLPDQPATAQSPNFDLPNAPTTTTTFPNAAAAAPPPLTVFRQQVHHRMVVDGEVEVSDQSIITRLLVKIAPGLIGADSATENMRYYKNQKRESSSSSDPYDENFIIPSVAPKKHKKNFIKKKDREHVSRDSKFLRSDNYQRRLRHQDRVWKLKNTLQDDLDNQIKFADEMSHYFKDQSNFWFNQAHELMKLMKPSSETMNLPTQNVPYDANSLTPFHSTNSSTSISQLALQHPDGFPTCAS